MNYTPPEGFALDPQSGRYYRDDGIINGQQWGTWFDAASGEYEQASYPAAQTPQPVAQPAPARPQPAPVRPQPAPQMPSAPPKPSAKYALLPVATVLLGLGVAFFQAGGLQAMESEAIPSEITLFDLDDAPVITLQKSGDSVDISTQALPDPTPDIASAPSPAPADDPLPTPSPTPTPAPVNAPKATDPVTVVHDDPATWVKTISRAEARRHENGFSFTIYHPEARAALERYDPDPSTWGLSGWYFTEYGSADVTYAPGGPGELIISYATGYITGTILYVNYDWATSSGFYLHIADNPFVFAPMTQTETYSPDIFIKWYGLYDTEGVKQEIGAEGVSVSYQLGHYPDDGSSYYEVVSGTATAHANGFSIANEPKLIAFYNELEAGGYASFSVSFTVNLAGVEYPGYASIGMYK